MRRYSFAIALAMLVAMPGATHAHGGGLNAEGCHNDRMRGDYHCHRGSSVPHERVPDDAARKNLHDGPEPRNGGAAFKNCTAARAAGAAPVRRGDPGYGRISIGMATAWAASITSAGGSTDPASRHRQRVSLG